MKKGFAPIIFLVIGLVVVTTVIAGTFYYKSRQNKPFPVANQITKLTQTQSPKISPTQNPSPLDSIDDPSHGKVIKTYSTLFDPKDFGINSPSFQGKNEEVTVIKFHGKEIKEKKIIVNETPYQGVVVWEFTKPQNSIVDFSNPDYAIFGGYENYSGNPSFIKDIQSGWKDYYVSSNSIKFGFSYDGQPHHLERIQLNSSQGSSINGNPIFITLGQGTSTWISTDETSWEETMKNPLVLDAKEKIKQFADTIKIK